MTLAELALEVAIETGAEEYDVVALARLNWPEHSTFTPTQMRLMAYLLKRKKENPCCNP